MEKINLNKIRISLDRAMDYIPIASTINNAIDLIQRRIFSHKTEPCSKYQKYILHKENCLINMVPFAKIIHRMRHPEVDQEPSPSEVDQEPSPSEVTSEVPPQETVEEINPMAFVDEIEQNEDLSQEERPSAIARVIDEHQIPLKKFLGRDESFFMDLAQHLHYADASDLEIENLNEFLEQCSNVVNLKCVSLRNLTSLPPRMLQLKTLDCSSNPGLTAINSEMPLLETLNCSGCPNLISITSELPQMKVFNGSRCENLANLPDELPECMNFDCTDCPEMWMVPRLGLFANIRSEYSEAPFNVDVDQLNAEPFTLLLRLGKQYFKTYDIPKVVYFEGHNRNEAIDARGLQRDFLARLFQNIFKKDFSADDHGKFLKITEDLMPQVWSESIEEKRAYQMLGELLGLCSDINSDYKTGPLFNVKLYKYIQAPFEPDSDSWFLHNFIRAHFTPEIVAWLLDLNENPAHFTSSELENLSHLIEREDNEDWTDEYIQAHKNQVYKQLISEAKADQTLLAISWMAQLMKQKIHPEDWVELAALNPGELQDRIEGILTPQALKNHLTWNFDKNVSEENRQKTQNFLFNWIDINSNKTRLSQLVQAVTGNRTITKTKIDIKVANLGSERIPYARTCYSLLSLTSQYESQDQFDKKLEVLLNSAGTGDGFSDK